MKVAISLPDPVFEAAERLARQLKTPRSRLYASAIAEYVGSRGSDSITARLDAIYAAQSSAVDQAFERAQLKSLSDETW